MREIRKIIVHCTAGSQRNKAADVVSYHTGSKSRGGLGWSRPGYHYIVEADGNIVETLEVSTPSNGVRGHNADSVNVCYVGGIDASGRPTDNRTEAQRASLLRLLRELRVRFPGAAIYGHRDFAAKACPSFDARKEYADL